MSSKVPRLVVNGRFLQQSVTGVQRVAVEFCRTLDGLLAEGAYPSLDVRVVLPRGGPSPAAPSFATLRCEVGGRLAGHAWEQLELDGLAGDAALLCLGNTAPMTRLLARRPTTVFVHDLSYAYFPAAYSRAFRALYGLVVPTVLSRADRVVTVSESERAAILARHPRRIGPDRLIASPNGARPGGPPPAPAPGREGRRRVCLYVGSLTLRKNADRLLAACLRLAEETDLDFVFAGASNASFAGVTVSVPPAFASRFRFLGQVDDPARLDALYREASVFLFPSLYESSGIPPTEAMSNGCPVVVSDIPALRERCGDAAAYCDPVDVASIVASVRAVLEDDARWEDLHRRGLARAGGFTWERQVRDVMAAMGFH